METHEIELDGYNTADGKPVLTVGLDFDDCDNEDFCLTGFSISDNIKLTEAEVCEIVQDYLKDRFKPEFS